MTWKDKIQHALICSVIVFVTVWFCRIFWPPIYIPLYQLLGGLIAFGWGWTKERIDQYCGGEFDKQDILADLIGICFGVLIS